MGGSLQGLDPAATLAGGLGAGQQAGGGKGKNVPAPPDYMGLVNTMGQQQSDLLNQQTYANRPNVSTPYGQYNWTPPTQSGAGTGAVPTATDASGAAQQQSSGLGSPFGGLLSQVRGDTATMATTATTPSQPPGQWSLDVQLSPEQQALLEQQQALGRGSNQAALDRLGQGISGQSVQDALYGQMTSRLDPAWDRRQEQQRTQLYNTGLREGDTAYNDRMQQFGQGRNDAYQQAMYQSILGGDQSAASQVNLINALRGGGQVTMPQQPGFNQAGQGQAPNLLGAAQAGYGADLNAYNAQQAQQQSIIQGGLALLPLLFSDARLKTKIRRLPVEALPGVPYASWEWKAGGHGFGVIAQDLQKVRPDLVVKGPGGFLMVDYNGIGGQP